MFGYTIPDKGEGINDAQSVLFQQCLEVLADSFQNFVQSGCAVTPQGAPNMTVNVAAGTVYSVGARIITAGNAALAIGAADATNARFDYVVITSGAVAAVRGGTPSAAPKPTNLSAGDVCIALIYIPANATSIGAANIYSRAVVSPKIAGENILLPAIANPAAPPADSLIIYARKTAGRVVPKFISPSGVDNAVQPNLWGNNIALYTSASGTTAGLSSGMVWNSGGTVSHPTPTAGITNQIPRTRWANVVTTTNQQLGIRASAASDNKFWRGNAAGLGGFFMFARFGIGLIPAATVRLFVGLSSLTSAITAADAVTGDAVGFWHDTTDSLTTISLLTRDNTTSTKTAIASVPTLAAGQMFDAYLYSPPNGGSIFYRLDNVNTDTTIVDTSIATTLPRSTIFLGPQALMSNGTANITVTTVAFELARLYVEADR
jgi:hypothetical protein